MKKMNRGEKKTTDLETGKWTRIREDKYKNWVDDKKDYMKRNGDGFYERTTRKSLRRNHVGNSE